MASRRPGRVRRRSRMRPLQTPSGCSGSCGMRMACETEYAAIVLEGSHFIALDEMIEMGNGFAHREHHLMVVERSGKQGGQQLLRAFRRIQSGQDGRAAFRVMSPQLRDSSMYSAKRPAVGGQHQRVFRQMGEALQ